MELSDALNFARANRWSVRRAVVRLTPDRADGTLNLPGRGEAEEKA